MEFAIVLPLLLIMVFGVVDVGRLLFAKISLASASQEAARASSLGMTTREATAAATAAAPGAASLAGLGSQALTVNVKTACSSSVANDQADVTVSTTFKWITPIGLFQAFDPDTTNGSDRALSSEAVAQCLV